MIHTIKQAGLAFALAIIGTSVASAQAPVTVGSNIGLQSRWSEGGRDNYLDGHGRIQDQAAFNKTPADIFVFTNSSPERDKGSGTWQIASAEGKNKGDALVYGDKVQLVNQYAKGEYLHVLGGKISDEYKAVLPNPDQTHYAIYASTKAKLKENTGTWIIKTYQGKDKAGDPITDGSMILLENAAFPGFFLRTSFAPASQVIHFSNYKGIEKLVFISDKGWQHGQEAWKVTLKK